MPVHYSYYTSCTKHSRQAGNWEPIILFIMDSESIIISQVVSASVSAVASASIVLGSLRAGGLTSPYSRIIFGLSMSDILQSLALVTGPFAVPSSTPTSVAQWAIGNNASCQTNGFLFNLGSMGTPLYMFGICLYTVLKIKKNMTDERFEQSIERPMHLLIVLSSFVPPFVGIIKTSIHSNVFGSVCTYAAFPTGCRQRPDIFGECDPAISKSTTILVQVAVIFTPIICLCGIIFCMFVICWHNRGEIKMFNPFHRKSRNKHDDSASAIAISHQKLSSQISNRKEPSGVGTSVVEECITNSKGQVLGDVTLSSKRLYNSDSLENVERGDAKEDSIGSGELDRRSGPSVKQDSKGKIIAIRREIIIQACCFIAAFSVTFCLYMCLNFALLLGHTPPMILVQISATLYPLGGLFNVIAYLRPKAACIRIEDPEVSWFQAFWVVIKASCGTPTTRMESVQTPGVAHEGEGIPTRSEKSTAFKPLAGGRSYASSGGCVNNNSQSFGQDNIAHRDQEEWDYNVGGLFDVGNLGYIAENSDEEENEEGDHVVSTDSADRPLRKYHAKAPARLFYK